MVRTAVVARVKTGSISVAHPAAFGPACVTARHSFRSPEHVPPPEPWIGGKRLPATSRRICNRLGCLAEQVFVDTRRNRRGGAWQDAYDWPVGWEATSWGKEGKRRQQARQRAKRQAAQQLVDARRWLAEHP